MRCAFLCLVLLLSLSVPLVHAHAACRGVIKDVFLSGEVVAPQDISSQTRNVTVLITWKAAHEALRTENVACDLRVTLREPPALASPFYTVNASRSTWSFTVNTAQDDSWEGSWQYILGITGVSLSPLNASVVLIIPSPILSLSVADETEPAFTKALSSPLTVEMKLSVSHYMEYREAVLVTAAIIFFVMALYFVSSRQLNNALASVAQEKKEREERRQRKANEIAASKQENAVVGGEGASKKEEAKPVVFRAKQERRRFVKKSPTKSSGIEF